MHDCVDFLKRQVDAGGQFRHHPVLLRGRHLLSLPATPARLGHHGPDHSRIFADQLRGRRAKFARWCGTPNPGWLDEAFDRPPRRAEQLLSTALVELCTDLIEGGVEDLHFYTLNGARPHLRRLRRAGRDTQGRCPRSLRGRPLPATSRRLVCVSIEIYSVSIEKETPLHARPDLNDAPCNRVG